MSKLFPVNEHPVERGLRIALGLALIGLAATGSIGPWGYVGAVPVVTGLAGSCPLYTLLGFATCPLKIQKAS
ncbi:MAG: DUF2892 domain-containing protein [Hyphomonas sp.]|nr:DUF2892 domain-containing protein [Hyphomonas sp.]